MIAFESLVVIIITTRNGCRVSAPRTMYYSACPIAGYDRALGLVSDLIVADELFGYDDDVFGGFGNDGVGNSGVLNDLWKFNPATSEWTWMAGSSTIGATVRRRIA